VGGVYRFRTIKERKKEEARRKKQEGRSKKEEGRSKKEEGRRNSRYQALPGNADPEALPPCHEFILNF
jgi:hypothetical protein